MNDRTWNPVCPVCKNLVTCTCDIENEHDPKCRFRIAATLSVELACEHGYQACPICDPCSCGLNPQPIV